MQSRLTKTQKVEQSHLKRKKGEEALTQGGRKEIT